MRRHAERVRHDPADEVGAAEQRAEPAGVLDDVLVVVAGVLVVGHHPDHAGLAVEQPSDGV